VLVAALFAARPALSALDTPPDHASPHLAADRDEVLESYLAELGLTDALAVHLVERLDRTAPDQRAHAAERLARLYARMLGLAATPDERREIEASSKRLLERVPEADTPELRVELAKASYLQAEQVAERHRLRLATTEQIGEATRTLEQNVAAFSSVRERLAARLRTLEQRERNPGDADLDALRADLAETRRVRSLASYYEGWSLYYLALLTGDNARAESALVPFGVLLGAVPSKPPSLERVPKGTLRFEHVARAALGVSMCLSLGGQEVDALRWLESLDLAEDLPRPVAEQLFAYRIAILANSGRWVDVEVAVDAMRRDESGRPRALPTPLARLLAVLALEQPKRGEVPERIRAFVTRMTQVALADLVAQGELAQVIDLVRRYGTLPIGDEGFIVAYVRGLTTYERARERHGALPGDADQPAIDPATVNEYRDAAKLFEAALRTEDSRSFRGEAARAELRLGLSRYYAGDAVDAADAFERAYGFSVEDVRQDALWYAIVALDLAVSRGQASQAARRDKLATMFVKAFPTSPNATRLLLRQSKTEGLTDAQALDILLAVTPDSPLFLASRKQAARILYQLHRRAASADRAQLALRFIELADQLLRDEATIAVEQAERAGAGDPVALDSAKAAVLRARQLLDVMLAQPVPDLPRVDATFAALDHVLRATRLDARDFEAELLFRRLQLALARSDERTAQDLADKLRALQGPFAGAGDQLLFRRVSEAWLAREDDPRLARQVIRHGVPLLDRAADQASLAPIRETVVRAAAALWRAEKDVTMRELALSLDGAQLDAGLRTIESLRRLAELREAKGDKPGALAAWDELLAGLDPGSDEWLEARHESLRLLLQVDPQGAARAYEQFRVLYPSGVPEPWADKLERLGLQMPPIAPGAAPAPRATPPTKKQGGGGP
jgi:hypothetical protein